MTAVRPAAPAPREPFGAEPQLVRERRAQRFAAAAATARPLLVARLRRLGAGRAEAEDLAQEALARAWERSLPYVDAADLLRWCTRVARNAHVDERRRRSRLVGLDTLLATPANAAADALDAVELRDVIRAVGVALDGLSEAQRASLEAPPAEGPATRDRSAQLRAAALRHRARSRLRLVVDRQ